MKPTQEEKLKARKSELERMKRARGTLLNQQKNIYVDESLKDLDEQIKTEEADLLIDEEDSRKRRKARKTSGFPEDYNVFDDPEFKTKK